MLLLKDFTAFFFNSCETIHVMNKDIEIKSGGSSVFFRHFQKTSNLRCCLNF